MHFDVYSYEKNVAHSRIESWSKTGEVCLKPSKHKRGYGDLFSLLVSIAALAGTILIR